MGLESEGSPMKRENIIDMSAYFLNLQQEENQPKSAVHPVKEIVYCTARVMETVATIVISLGFCACTYLFFAIV